MQITRMLTLGDEGDLESRISIESEDDTICLMVTDYGSGEPITTVTMLGKKEAASLAQLLQDAANG